MPNIDRSLENCEHGVIRRTCTRCRRSPGALRTANNITAILGRYLPKLRLVVTRDAIAEIIDKEMATEEVNKALVAASHALKSYVYGNQAKALAVEVAVQIDTVIAKVRDGELVVRP